MRRAYAKEIFIIMKDLEEVTVLLFALKSKLTEYDCRLSYRKQICWKKTIFCFQGWNSDCIEMLINISSSIPIK